MCLDCDTTDGKKYPDTGEAGFKPATTSTTNHNTD